MPRTTFRFRAAAPVLLLAALALAGCASTKDGQKDGDKDAIPIPSRAFAGDDLYEGVPWKSILNARMDYISDSDVNFSARDEAEKIANWVKERRDAVKWCLEQRHVLGGGNPASQETVYKRVWPDDPKRPETRYDQAIAILFKILENVPSDTPARRQLAIALYHKGAVHYWNVDAAATQIDQLGAQRPDGYQTKIADLQREVVEPHRKAMIAFHVASRSQFELYMNKNPIDKTPWLYLWSCEFQLGNFKRAKQWLDQILALPELDRMAREELTFYRKSINDYLAEYEINRDAPKPLSSEAEREQRRRAAPADLEKGN